MGLGGYVGYGWMEEEIKVTKDERHMIMVMVGILGWYLAMFAF